MKKVLLPAIALFFASSICYADVIKGTMEKVDIKTYEITVNGLKVSVAKATVFTENDMKVTKNVIVRDLKDHAGEAVVCYGSVDKNNIFEAYKVRVLEGHR